MGERVIGFTNSANSGAGADATLMSAGFGLAQNESVSNLPTASQLGAKTVRIRATVMVTVAGTGSLIIKVKNSAGTVINGVTSIASGNVAGGFAPIEVVDTAPVGPLVYTVSGQATTATTCSGAMEVEVLA